MLDDPGPAHRPDAAQRSASRQVLVVVALIGLTLAGGAALLRSDMRAAQWTEAGRTAENLALGLERDITRVVEGYDRSLQHAAQAYALPGFDALPPDIQRSLLFDSVALAIPNGMAVMDRDGKPVFSSNYRQYGTMEFGDRDWFKAHRDAPKEAGGSTGLFVSAPLIGKLTGARNVPFSRRITGPDGAFRGVVVTTIQASFAQDLFDMLKLGPQSTISLATLDGGLVARTPYDPTDFGRDVGRAQVFSLLPKAPTGLYEGRSVTDGIYRLSAYRRVASAPFVVVVGLAERDIYAPWYQTARVVGAVLALVLALAAGLGWTLWREFRRRATAERTTQATAARLEAVIGTVPAAIWFTEDSDASHVVGNRYADDLMRVPHGANPSLTAPEVERPQHFRVLRNGVEVLPRDLPIQQAARGKDVPAQEYEVTFANGTTATVLVRATPLRDPSGALAGAVCAAIDVTERKQAEVALRASEDALRRLNEQLEVRVAAEVAAREQAQASLAQAQRMEALGQLAGGIAHDFNNVLQAVSGGLGLIGRRADNPAAVRELARMADAATKRGAAITGRLLSFARKGELQAMPVPPVELLDGLREMLAPTLGANIQVLTSVAPDAPALLADRAQLETVLVNLAVNARDAMPDGGTLRIAATVEAVADTHPAELNAGTYVRLDLTDTGTGMTAATLARASEPFFTTKPPGQGTGLGLAMARGFAEQSNGGFALRSAPGQGTTVTLWFPRADAVPDAGRPNVGSPHGLLKIAR